MIQVSLVIFVFLIRIRLGIERFEQQRDEGRGGQVGKGKGEKCDL